MPYPTQDNITDVRAAEGDGDLRVWWQSTDPPGTVFQLYLDRTLVWSGTQRRCHVPVPPHRRRLALDVLAVDRADIRVNRSDVLPAAHAERVRLWWYGGPFLGAVERYDVFSGPAPGASVVYSATVGSVPAGLAPDGFGVGVYGSGGFGSVAQVYTWTSEPLAPGSWHFAVIPYGSDGNPGVPKPFTATVAGPPQAPPPYPGGPRVLGTYDAGTAALTLTWRASRP